MSTHRPTREESIAAVLEACDGAFGSVDDGTAPRMVFYRCRPIVSSSSEKTTPVESAPSAKTWTVVESTDEFGIRRLVYIQAGKSTERPEFYPADLRGRERPWKVLTTVTARTTEERSNILVAGGFIVRHDKGRVKIARRSGVSSHCVYAAYNGGKVSTAVLSRIVKAAKALGYEPPLGVEK